VIGNSGCRQSTSAPCAGLVPALLLAESFHDGPLDESWRVVLLRPFRKSVWTTSRRSFDPTGARDEREGAGGHSLRTAGTSSHWWRGPARTLSLPLATPMPKKQGTLACLRFWSLTNSRRFSTLTASREMRARYVDALLSASRLDGVVPIHVVIAATADSMLTVLDHPALSRSLEKQPLQRASHERRNNYERTIEKSVWRWLALRLSLAGRLPARGCRRRARTSCLAGACAWPIMGDVRRPRAHDYQSRLFEIGRLREPLGRHADPVYEGLGWARTLSGWRNAFPRLVSTLRKMRLSKTRAARAERHDLLCLDAPKMSSSCCCVWHQARLIATSREADQDLRGSFPRMR